MPDTEPGEAPVAPADGAQLPASPRSPRPAGRGLPMPGGTDLPPGLPPGVFIAPPPPRPNLGSLLFMAAWFFFMNGGNNMPQSAYIGENGQIQMRQTELGLIQEQYVDYRSFVNGTGNWSEPAAPEVQPFALLPHEYRHPATHAFYDNITGFYRDARVHPINLLHPPSSSPPFFHNVVLPAVNTTGQWNETLVADLQGEWDFQAVNKWSMNLKERNLFLQNHTDWTWVKGSATLSATGDKEIEYDFWGLHFVPNGTYNLFGLPDGMRIDIRNIPRLFPEHANVTRHIILAELEKELRIQEQNMLLTDATPDENTLTKCPLMIHLTVPQIPFTTTPNAVKLYEDELHACTGIRWSLPRPPGYWEGRGMGGVAIADQCGWAFGIEGGKGIRLDDFWRKSINYASFASASQLIVLLLLVRQMEATRTPSTLTKVSVPTIVMMGIADSWIFSAHAVMGIVSDNRTSMPMLVPGFFCLCTAIVFVPRYAVLLHRIQAPERANTTAAGNAQRTNTAPVTGTTPTAGDAAQPSVETESAPLIERLRSALIENKGLRFAGGMLLLLIFFNVAFLPSMIPFLLFIMYSFWLPQIWRNARQGNTHAMDHRFVLGTSLGRLALPLYIFGCPDNVFFVQRTNWVWILVFWQCIQIIILHAQERFDPSFFLPKRFAPAESYNYHPLLPPSDPENPTMDTEKTCSICMEEVDTRPGPSGEVLLGMNPRRAYALAPCHHLFHTKCLSQWMAIKTICPLCKRSLPPL